jgi:hypothetical protein
MTQETWYRGGRLKSRLKAIKGQEEADIMECAPIRHQYQYNREKHLQVGLDPRWKYCVCGCGYVEPNLKS